MSTDLIYVTTAVVLIGLGLYTVLIRRHLVRKLMAVNILGSGVFILFIALASSEEGDADPVPQAMVLTGIVVAVSATALGLVLIRRIDEADLKNAELGGEER